MAKLERTLELEFTILEFYPKFVISNPREGIVLDQKQLGDLIEACSGHYLDENFVFLINRKSDYNVNPTIYIDVEQVANLAGIGVVAQKKTSIDMASFEKNFCKVPYEIFPDMTTAQEWAENLVTEKNKKADL